MGVPQKSVKSLREQIMAATIGTTGYIYVLDTQGHYVISKDGKRDGGKHLGGEGRPRQNRADYALRDLGLGDRGRLLREVATHNRMLQLSITGDSLLLAVILWMLIARNIAGAFNRITENLTSGAEQTLAAAEEVSATNQSLAEGASEQAASREVLSFLEAIAAGNHKVNTLITEIAAAGREQAQGLEQISTAVGQMDQVTQSTAASAEESASASEELAAQADTLNGMVNNLLGVVGGSSAPRPAADPTDSDRAADRRPARDRRLDAAVLGWQSSAKPVPAPRRAVKGKSAPAAIEF